MFLSRMQNVDEIRQQRKRHIDCCDVPPQLMTRPLMLSWVAVVAKGKETSYLEVKDDSLVRERYKKQ